MVAAAPPATPTSPAPPLRGVATVAAAPSPTAPPLLLAPLRPRAAARQLWRGRARTRPGAGGFAVRRRLASAPAAAGRDAATARLACPSSRHRKRKKWKAATVFGFFSCRCTASPDSSSS
ncbi:hypothetical protein ACP70R_035241 [Stipagrostis hirtigluma subsp. patula]